MFARDYLMNFFGTTFFFAIFFLSAFFVLGNEDEKIIEALPAKPSVLPAQARKVLVYSHSSGYKHSSIPTGVKALRLMAKKTKAFEAVFTVKPDEFNQRDLAKYDGIIFNNCTHVQKAFTEPSQRSAILSFIKSGKGFAGFHAASDGGMPQWPEYTDMIGGCFAGHPWNAGGTWPFFLEDSTHPVNAAFGKRPFSFSDEIYQYKSYDRSKLRVLVGLDALKTDKSGNSKTHDYPVSWVKSYGRGRIFYTNFGHNKATWWTPFMLQHFMDGIQWSLGDLEGSSHSLPQTP